jgi:enoyl-CoA hydratase
MTRHAWLITSGAALSSVPVPERSAHAAVAPRPPYIKLALNELERKVVVEGPTWDRRNILKATAAVSGLLATTAASAQTQVAPESRPSTSQSTVSDVSSASGAKITVERRGTIVLIGINRPDFQNRIDPETYFDLAKALYKYDHDPSLRAAVLFGHGENFSRGIDVAGFRPIITAGGPFIPKDATHVQDPLEKATPARLSKPLVVVVHGDTWNMAHEIFLAADIRIAAANTDFGQDENTHGRFPGGGSTVRFVREAGWGNAMRYMLTGDHWSAEEAYRMRTVQQVSPSPDQALIDGIAIANKVSACAPLGIQTTLASAHAAILPAEMPALSNLDKEFGRLFHTHDFKEGVQADAQGRAPVYRGY